MKTTSFILFLLFPVFSFSQDFKLSGDFSGNNTENIVLRYTDVNGNSVSDTMKVENGKFHTKGKLSNAQKVLIIGNTDFKYMEDPNVGNLFLEPGIIEIKLKENDFQNIIIDGSRIHEEYKLVENNTKPLRLKLDSIAKNRSENSSSLLMAGHEKIQKIELCYAIENPKSELSPYFLDYYMRSIPLDSVNVIFNSFSIENKNSTYGKKIYDLLDKKIVRVDDIAPDFNVKDISGNILSLESYKGKYLLIDFWADWCKPCIAKFPDVKLLIDKYGKRGLEVLFVSLDKNEEDWKKGVKKHDISKWDHTYIGKNYKSKESITYKFDIQPIPAYILIDPKGKVIGRYAAASKENKDFSDLVNQLKFLMK